MYTTSDINNQHKVLDELSKLVDKQKIKSSFNQNMGKINTENLKMHTLLLNQKSQKEKYC